MIFGGKPKANNPNQPKRRSLVVEAFNPHIGNSIRPIGQSFGMIVNLIAMIFVTQGLFPRNHPAFSGQPGAPKLRFADVFTTAWSNLSFTKEGLPKVLMFFAVIASIILSAFGVITIVLTLLTGSAHAQGSPTPPQGFFTPANTTNDIGYNLIPFLFGTPAEQATAYTNLNTNAYVPFACGTPPAAGCAMPNNNIQTALGNGLGLYSGAMLIFAAIILFYHLASMVVETAHSGVAMGRRANQIWAPIRLVAAVVLLVPIAGGLNSGQLIVLKMAQWGSGLASNVWDVFKTNMALAGNGTPFATPAVGSIEQLTRAVTIMAACEYQANNITYGGFLSDPSLTNSNDGYNPNPDFFVNAWSNNFAPGSTWDYTTDPALYNNAMSLTYTGTSTPPWIEATDSATIYHFRAKADTADTQDYCGSISIPKQPDFKDTTLQAEAIALYNAQINTFNQYLPQMLHYATNVKQYIQGSGQTNIQGNINPDLSGTSIVTIIGNYQKDLENAVYQATINTVAMNDKYVGAGWMGAGAFYNQVANIAIEMQAAVDNYQPQFKYPAANMHDFRQNIDNDITEQDQMGTAVPKFVPQGDGCATGNAANDWESQSATAIKKADGSLFDIILGLLDVAASNLGVWCGDGTIGIRFTGANPLSQMAMWGQHNVNLAIDTINVSSMLMISGALSQWGMAGKIANGAMAVGTAAMQNDKNSPQFNANLKAASWASAMGLTKFTGGLASTIGGFLLPFSILFMTLGFMFGYMLPILPFMHFMFAGISWLAILLEAVIALPLVALGHINPEGEGLPGQYARDAYFMAFSILLRPVLMIFGLMAGFIIMELAVTLLNIFFATAMTGNTDGHDTLMKLIYTIIYGVMVYSISNHAFQLINYIPNKIMGWIGARGVEGTPMGQPETIINYSGIGVGALDRQVVGQLTGGISRVGQAGQASQAAAAAQQNQADTLKALNNLGKKS